MARNFFFLPKLTILLIFVTNLYFCQRPPGEEILYSLPENEREDFLAFSLGKAYEKSRTGLEKRIIFPFPEGLGITKDRLDKFQNLNVPENFTTNLYVWVGDHFNMGQPELRGLILNRQVCLPNDKCIDMADVGGLCCPF